jgi:hypothetical protein
VRAVAAVAADGSNIREAAGECIAGGFIMSRDYPEIFTGVIFGDSWNGNYVSRSEIILHEFMKYSIIDPFSAF